MAEEVLQVLPADVVRKLRDCQWCEEVTEIGVRTLETKIWERPPIWPPIGPPP